MGTENDFLEEEYDDLDFVEEEQVEKKQFENKPDKRRRSNLQPHVRLLLKINGYLISYKNSVADNQKDRMELFQSKIDDGLKELQIMGVEVFFNEETKKWRIRNKETATSVDIVTYHAEKVQEILRKELERIVECKLKQEIELAQIVENSVFEIQKGNVAVLTEITNKNVTKKCLESQEKILDAVLMKVQRVFE